MKRIPSNPSREKGAASGNLSCVISLVLLIFSLLSACQSKPIIQTSPERKASPTTSITADISPTSITEYTHAPLPQSKGPFLLIQTEVDTYKIFDLSSGSVFPISMPSHTLQFNLSANLSPSGQRLHFLLEDGTSIILNLVTGQVDKTISHTDNTSRLDVDQVIQAVHSNHDLQHYPVSDIKSWIEKAYQQSITHIQWYQSDKYWLIPRSQDNTSTQLNLYDHESGTYNSLESLPAFVHDYWVSPDGESILLKKGFIFEPSIWQDDRYYIINLEKKTTEPIPLPETSNNPAISWFSDAYIGITHQVNFIGGIDFSLLDLHTMKTNQVVEGSFSGIYPFASQLLVLRVDPQAKTTSLTVQTFENKISSEKTLLELCTVKRRIDEQRLLMNCENESILIKGETLSLTPFSSPISIFSRSPDRSHVIISDENQSILYNSDFQNPQQLLLNESPMQILWLPDSSGFLYRASNHLYHYHLSSKTNQIIYASDFFNDYRNLNAIWIQPAEN